MIVEAFRDAPPADLASALERFEEQFTYPLGPGRSFRISHGTDYPRFFRAMGEPACFVATSDARPHGVGQAFQPDSQAGKPDLRERGGRVVGVLGCALRRLQLPNGTECPAVYLGDLKVDPQARGGRALPQLAQAAMRWVAARAKVAFSVVMDGTRITPTRYTGRLGIPPFQELGKIMVLRIATRTDSLRESATITDALGAACYVRLSAGRYACPGGFPSERSEIAPTWLMTPDGDACGRLEDTRRAKRLIADDGVEMQSAHLSCFAYHDVIAGVVLLKIALARAAERGLPALFVAVPTPDAEAFCAALALTDIVTAPATVFGTGLAPGALWNINTAEI